METGRLKEPLSRAGKIGYATGMLGFSILINIISVMLIYVYVPPSNSGLGLLVPQLTVLGIFSLLSLVVASGRLFDAVTDPLVAYFSDRSGHRKGRRIPFMKWAILPSAILAVLVFIPLKNTESSLNLWWLAGMQLLFYLALTVYIVPYNALLPELAGTKEEKVQLSAYLSIGYVGGIVVSSQTPLLADWVREAFQLESRLESIQWAIGLLAAFSALCLLIPVFSIDERRHCVNKPIDIPLLKSLRQTLSNRNFLCFVLAEGFYFIAVTIMVSGLLYYLRVLLDLEESLGGFVMGAMVLTSLLFYPFVGRLVNRFGNKRIILFCFLYLGILLGGIFFMGRVPIDPRVQIFGFALFASMPLAFLGILPFAIVAELAERDGQASGQPKEALFFAIRNLANKFGQTIGIMLFAILTLFGKDPGNDFGIRLSGLIGLALCVLAVLFFSRYQEE